MLESWHDGSTSTINHAFGSRVTNSNRHRTRQLTPIEEWSDNQTFAAMLSATTVRAGIPEVCTAKQWSAHVSSAMIVAIQYGQGMVQAVSLRQLSRSPKSHLSLLTVTF